MFNFFFSFLYPRYIVFKLGIVIGVSGRVKREYHYSMPLKTFQDLNDYSYIIENMNLKFRTTYKMKDIHYFHKYKSFKLIFKINTIYNF